MSDNTPEQLREEARLCREDAERERRSRRLRVWQGRLNTAHSPWADQMDVYAAHLEAEADKAKEPKPASPLPPEQWQVGDVVVYRRGGVAQWRILGIRRGDLWLDGGSGTVIARHEEYIKHSRPPLEPGTVVMWQDAPWRIAAKCLVDGETRYLLWGSNQIKARRDDLTVIKLPKGGEG